MAGKASSKARSTWSKWDWVKLSVFQKLKKLRMIGWLI